MLQTIILCIVLLTALLFDFLKCKIPNVLVAAGYLTGILYFLISDSLWYFRITDSILILVLMYPLFLLGAFGGGDIKLLAVISLFIGFEETLHAALLAVFIGAALSVLKIIQYKFTKKKFKISNLYIHFSLPIFLGTIITQCFGGLFIWKIF